MYKKKMMTVALCGSILAGGLTGIGGSKAYAMDPATIGAIAGGASQLGGAFKSGAEGLDTVLTSLKNNLSPLYQEVKTIYKDYENSQLAKTDRPAALRHLLSDLAKKGTVGQSSLNIAIVKADLNAYLITQRHLGGNNVHEELMDPTKYASELVTVGGAQYRVYYFKDSARLKVMAKNHNLVNKTDAGVFYGGYGPVGAVNNNIYNINNRESNTVDFYPAGQVVTGAFHKIQMLSELPGYFQYTHSNVLKWLQNGIRR
ncbi:hypothetical protein [Bacillus sp. CDB3]|uniref:hypothetical protein n=1 Tax=Bacillus sp. CDB3 TaxID=360310 RepID=UPI0009D85CB6|nr:hypothetical protein [Bacillus sp. CDB3]OQR53455.1 hypothetical protein CDB3_29655 [Bacillus sp. CDB3]